MTDKYNLDVLNNLDQFFQFFNNRTDLILLTKVNKDKKFSYVLANKPVKELCGLTDNSLGKPLNELIPDKAYQRIKSKYIEAMDMMEPITFEEKMIVPSVLANGENYNYFPKKVVYLESTITPVFNQEGLCTHLLAIVRDITELIAE
jgi:diguanylate cyclase